MTYDEAVELADDHRETFGQGDTGADHDPEQKDWMGMFDCPDCPWMVFYDEDDDEDDGGGYEDRGLYDDEDDDDGWY